MTRAHPSTLGVALATVALAASNALRPTGTLVLAAAVAGAASLVLLGCGRLHVMLLVVTLAAWAWGGARLAAIDRSALLPLVGTAGRIEAVVTAEPRVGRFGQRQPARVRALDGRRLDEPVQLDLPLGRAPPRGAIVSMLAVVRLPRPAEGGFDERRWLRRQGVHVVLDVDEWHATGRRGGLAGAADRLRAWLRAASAPGLAGERRAVLEGVVLGDDARLDDDLKTSFRRSGLYHLLAVSGQNVVLLAAGVLGLAWLAGAPRAWGHVGAVAAILAYVAAVGPQPSVIRAAISGTAMSIAWLVARERSRWHVLLLAAAALLAWNPYTLFDPGFQLSFVAVAAIFVAVGPALSVLEGYPLPRRLASVLPVSAACSVATAPVLWLQFGQVPLLGVVANVLVEPVVGCLLGLALATAALDPIVPPLAEILAELNGWVAAYVIACARLVGAIPFAQVDGGAAAAAAAGALLATAYAWRRWRTSFSRPT